MQKKGKIVVSLLAATLLGGPWFALMGEYPMIPITITVVIGWASEALLDKII
jgi:hypothetical protein